ncbi:MAG: hypothetical protein M3317_12440 [Actinomycetota bacterium]|nr:hypothetical protein [Actinomycetota bacterium]
MAAKLLVIGGEQMAERLDGCFQAVFTDRYGHTASSFDRKPEKVGT